MGMVWASTHQGLGISESTSSTARGVRERFDSCHQGNAGELEWGALAGILFPSSPQSLRESCSMCSPNHAGSIGFDIGSDFSRCPPSEITRDYPPLISGWLDCESELILRVSPGTGSSSFSERVERSPLSPVPALGQRPSTRYGHSSAFLDARTSDSRTCKELQVGTEPAILVHTSDNTIRSKFKVPSGVSQSSR